METPPPVNLSGMEAILANARKIMAVTDKTKPIVLSENTKKQVEIEEQEDSGYVQTSPKGYTNEQVMASNFPQAVKDAMMLKNEPVQSYSTTNYDDAADWEDKPMVPNKRPAQVTQQKPIQIQESIQPNRQGLITISEAELNKLVDSRIMSFLTQSYNKTLSEEVIKKTMNILIKEGKLSLKKNI